MTGTLDLSNHQIIGLGNPTSDRDGCNKGYIDNITSLMVNKAGDTLAANLGMNLNKIINIGDAPKMLVDSIEEWTGLTFIKSQTIAQDRDT